LDGVIEERRVVRQASFALLVSTADIFFASFCIAVVIRAPILFGLRLYPFRSYAYHTLEEIIEKPIKTLLLEAIRVNQGFGIG